MAQADFGTGKTLVVLAIVLGCFAVLWPKIFYPMMQTAFAMTSPKVDSDGRIRDTDRPPHLHPASANTRGRGPSPEDVHDKFLMREGRPFPHPQSRQPTKSQPKSGGAMSIIMPIYTVGIVVFFLYTVLKLVFKKPNEGDKKPLIKDFHMDPEYRKFVCEQSPSKNPRLAKTNQKITKIVSNTITATIPEAKPEPPAAAAIDPKDHEINKLRKKLEETEQAMERIIQHMGVVNACLTERVQLEKKMTDNQGNDVRQRHVGGEKRQKPSPQHSGVEEVVNGDGTTLEEDLSELISLCSATGHSLKEYSPEEDRPDSGGEEEEEGSDSEDNFCDNET